MSAKKISRPAKRRPTAAHAPRVIDPLPGAGAPADAIMLLAFAAPAVPGPSPAVKRALLARVRESRAPVPSAAGWRFDKISAGAGAWVKLPIPGLRLRELAIDRARDTALLFVEMAPGAIFPDHDHSVTERGLVLTGDLRMDDRLLGAGDFYEAAAGTRHERIASPSGCTGLLWVGAEAWERWRALAAS
jgi:quercetin dioxygenase-like cupin family protein